MGRTYESMLIVRPDLSDEERESVFSKITGRIKELGGEVREARIWAKERAFCYGIRARSAEKKLYNKGLYWLVDFSLSVSKLAGLKETIKLEDKIIRHIIINRSQV